MNEGDGDGGRTAEKIKGQNPQDTLQRMLTLIVRQNRGQNREEKRWWWLNRGRKKKKINK